MATAADPITLPESVCLALIAEEAQHGWSLVRLLAADGAIGRVWSLSRPLTYRAIDALVDRGLIAHRGTSVGDGPRRQIYAATAAGRRSTDRWLVEPVDHLRDVRAELLLKLVLTERRGGDPRPLLRAQQERFGPLLTERQLARRGPNADAVDRWRYESSLAVRRFIDGALDEAERTFTSRK